MQSIAFDDPWLAAALDDGSALLLNIDAAMRGGRSGTFLTPILAFSLHDNLTH